MKIEIVKNGQGRYGLFDENNHLIDTSYSIAYLENICWDMFKVEPTISQSIKDSWK